MTWYGKLLDILNLRNGITQSDSVLIPLNKWGRYDDIDTADAALGQIIWPISAVVADYIFIDTPLQLRIVSDSAEDGAGTLTGALTVKVTYQDSNGVQLEEVKTMNGTTFVNLTEALSYGGFRMEVETSGSTNGNVGNVVLEDSANNIYAIMSPGEGQTQIACQRIPNTINGKTVVKGIIRRSYAEYGRVTGGSNTADMRLKIRKADGTIVTKDDPQITTVMPEHDHTFEVGGIDVEPGQWVFWECISVSADGTPVRAGFDIVYELEGA